MMHKLENPVRLAELAPVDTLGRIGLSEGKAFCDIGAGTGVFTLPAADISKPAAVYAVEISEQMRGILRGRNGGFEIADNILAVPDSSCDVALLCAVMHELNDVSDMSRQIRRVLKERGVLAVIEYHKQPSAFGPPMELRLSEDEVVSALSGGFSFAERFDLGKTFYCLIFNAKGL